MMQLQTSRGRASAVMVPGDFLKMFELPISASNESQSIHQAFANLRQLSPTFSGRTLSQDTLKAKIYDALASFKIYTAQIAMHIDDVWKRKLFGQLDSLLSAEEWDTRDVPPVLGSYATFLRLMVLIRPHIPPGLGATSNGHIVGAWTLGADRLTIECLPGDQTRWAVKVSVEGEVERAAGEVAVNRLLATLSPYGPSRWLQNA